MEKLKPKPMKNPKAGLVALSTRNEDGSVPISGSEKEKNFTVRFLWFKAL
jgi:hypothetical protein